MKSWTIHALSGLQLLSPPAMLRAEQPPSTRGNPDATLSPYFFVNGGDASTDALPLKSTRAKVAIAGVVAEVRITQVYSNHGKRPIDAIYVFPGSTRAAVHGLKMTVGDRTIQAQIQERDQARATFQQAKQEGRSASLLEQERPNVFQMNVANILPGDEIKVELSYTELLVPAEGVYSFVFPTVVGPRYAGVAGTSSSTGERWVANPYTQAGVAPFSTFDLDLVLAGGLPIQDMTCTTHKTTIDYDGPEQAKLRLDPGETRGGNRDFNLKYRLKGSQVQSGLLLHRGERENFFLLMAQPPKRVDPKDLPPREFVFVMDVSGSQMGFPLEVSKALMNDMIQNLRPQDSFNVMVFEGSAALWSPMSKPADPVNLQSALAFVGQQSGGGGTELRAALMKALGLPRVPGLSRTFVVSTDGFISADGSVFDLIREHLGEANLFAFGIGSSVNRHLIEGMAHAGMGEAFVVTRPEEAAATAARFRSYVSSPVLTNLKLTTNGFQIYDFDPKQLPDVLADRPVVCIGKWKGEATGSLTLSGMTATGAWEKTFQVTPEQSKEEHAALRQLWARNRIQVLSDYNLFGATAARRTEVTGLGLGYSLLTAYTSFVAVDSQVRSNGDENLQVVQPLPMPQGVANSAIGGSAGAAAFISPGVVSTRGQGGSAVVEVVASAASFDRTMAGCMATTVGIDELTLVDGGKPVAREKRALGFSVGPVRSDREEVPLARVATLTEHKLRELAQEPLMRGLPDSFTLRIVVDASGAVLSVHLDPPDGTAGTLLEQKVRQWRYEIWTVPGRTTLSIPIRVVR